MTKTVYIEMHGAATMLEVSDVEDARRLARFNNTGEGVPWAEVKTWMQSWGSERELPAPKPRKLD